jgi:hypothetical protein
MTEGWHNEDYLITFEERESIDLSLRYEIDKYLAGYRIVGLRGWDDFIVAGVDGKLFTVPTVPLDRTYLTPCGSSIRHLQLRQDDQLRGRIKWYTKPLAFGGDPGVGENMTWVNLEQHIKLVNWWNNLYQTMKAQPKESRQ